MIKDKKVMISHICFFCGYLVDNHPKCSVCDILTHSVSLPKTLQKSKSWFGMCKWCFEKSISGSNTHCT